MKLEQTHWSAAHGWTPAPPGRLGREAQLVLAFGSRSVLQSLSTLDEVRQAYPNAHVTGCSTAGEICGTSVFDDTLVVTAASFLVTPVTMVSAELSEAASSDEIGVLLGERLAHHALRHVLV